MYKGLHHPRWRGREFHLMWQNLCTEPTCTRGEKLHCSVCRIYSQICCCKNCVHTVILLQVNPHWKPVQWLELIWRYNMILCLQVHLQSLTWAGLSRVSWRCSSSYIRHWLHQVNLGHKGKTTSLFPSLILFSYIERDKHVQSLRINNIVQDVCQNKQVIYSFEQWMNHWRWNEAEEPRAKHEAWK